MKNQIKSVQDYFKNKILNAEFTVVRMNSDNVVAEILIDGEYNFALWLHLPENNYRQYDSTYSNFIKLNDFTPLEIKKGYKKAKPLFDAYIEQVSNAEKLKAFNDSKKELKELGLI